MLKKACLLVLCLLASWLRVGAQPGAGRPLAVAIARVGVLPDRNYA